MAEAISKHWHTMGLSLSAALSAKIWLHPASTALGWASQHLSAISIASLVLLLLACFPCK